MSGRPNPGGILESDEDLFRRLEQLNEIGAALSQEKNIDHLLEKILVAAKAITRAAARCTCWSPPTRVRA
jgi:hypothetical protein